jgi:hypothetical protein
MSSTGSPAAASMSATDPLKVYVRVRPFTAIEKKKLFSPGSTPTSDGTVLFGESPLTYYSQEEGSAVRMKDTTVHLSMQGRGSTPFTFDDVFWSNSDIPLKATDVDDEGREGVKEYASQESVFESVGRPLVDNALMGYNSALIAYGQTGSGKTHTIFGPGAEGASVLASGGSQPSSGANTPRNTTSSGSLPTPVEDGRGLIPRVCDEVFSRLNSKLGASGEVHTVTMSMWELYLEDVFDLLQHRKKLAVRQDTPASFCVVGHREVPVRSYSEVLQLIKDGECLKTTAATAMNARSSRAHTLFQLKITTRSNVGVRVSKVVLADLAGCERIKVAKTEKGTALDEACNINLSLLSLGNCIESAVQRSKTGKTTENMGEFRQSVLTKLLKEFIGGNSRTAIMVTIAPTLADSNLSLQALRFANRAKQIQNHATVNLQLMKSVSDMSMSGSGVDWEVAGVREAYAIKLDLLKKECHIEMSRVSAKRRYQAAYGRVADLRAERDECAKSGPHVDPTAPSTRTRLLQLERALEAATNELKEAQKAKEELDEQLLQICKDSQHVLSDKEALQQEVDTLRLSLADATNEQADAVLQHEIEMNTLERSTTEKLKTQRLEFEDIIAGLQRNIAVITSNASRQLASLSQEATEGQRRMEAHMKEHLAVMEAEETHRCSIIFEFQDAHHHHHHLYFTQMAQIASNAHRDELDRASKAADARVGVAVAEFDAKLAEAATRMAGVAEELKRKEASWEVQTHNLTEQIRAGVAAQDQLRRQIATQSQSGAVLAQQCSQARDALSAALAAFNTSASAVGSLEGAQPLTSSPIQWPKQQHQSTSKCQATRSVSSAQASEDITEYLNKNSNSCGSPSSPQQRYPTAAEAASPNHVALKERSASLSNMTGF